MSTVPKLYSIVVHVDIWSTGSTLLPIVLLCYFISI